jgi:1-acyl-sn-glycerol-3-phosphate acyltransferase
MGKCFVPPKPNALVIEFAKAILPLVLQKEHLVVRPSPHCITSIRQLKNVHTVILMNHSDKDDPLSAAFLSKTCGEQFLYLAARELFKGFLGWFGQHCGVYSVMRGEPEDIESRDATVSLIARGDRKLVMFPEGDVTGRDDEIMPLKVDGLFNMFEAQRKLVNQNKPIFLLPIVAYYEVQDDAIQPLLESVSRLEAKLGLSRQGFSLESRLTHVLADFLEQIEEHYGLNSGREFPPDHRLDQLSRQVTKSIAQYNGIDIDDEMSEHAILYCVRGHIERMMCGESAAATDYAATLEARALRRAQNCLADLCTMQQLLILSSTLQQHFTLESAWRILDRLEAIVLGRTFPKGNRMAWIDSAQPVSLLDFWGTFESDPHRATRMVDRRVRTVLNDTLHRLRERRQLTLIND